MEMSKMGNMEEWKKGKGWEKVKELEQEAEQGFQDLLAVFDTPPDEHTEEMMRKGYHLGYLKSVMARLYEQEKS